MKRRLALPLVALLAAGCGGRGAALPASRPAARLSRNLTVHFAWPQKAGRVIPVSSASVKIVATQGGTTYGTATLVNPATTATLTDMPLGTVTVTATAYPTAGATGTPMATATTTTTVAADGTSNVDLTMASTVTRLVIGPTTITLSLSTLLTQQTTITAYDANNAVVLSNPTDYTYSTGNGLLLTVNATGLVSGLALGVGSLSVTHKDSGVTASTPVRITL